MSQAIAQFVNALHRGLVFRSIYFGHHPKVLDAAEAMLFELNRMHEEAKGQPIFLGVAKHFLVCDGRAMLDLTPLARRPINLFDRLGAGGMRFLPGATSDEFLELLTIYADHREPVDLESARGLLKQHGITHFELSDRYGMPGWSGGAGIAVTEGGDAAVAVPEEYAKAFLALMEIVDTSHVNAARGGTIDVAGARTRAEGIVGSSDGRKLHELLTFAQYSDFDAYTIGHSVRVALLVTLVTEQLGLARDLMIEISAAALLHDVGKSQIPQEILYKSGPLTDEERRVVSMHPRFGGEILLESREANPWSVCAAYGHHVRHDRRGYPTLPRWAQTSRATALIQVCDVFEALTAVRPYKPPLTPHEAYAIMMRDHKAFDPSALKAFVRAIGLYPPGSRVVLSDGREGIVRRAGEAMGRPALEVRKLADGTALPFDASPLLDLADPANAALTIQQIVREPTIDVDADPFNYENRATTIVLRDVTIDPCSPASGP